MQIIKTTPPATKCSGRPGTPCNAEVRFRIRRNVIDGVGGRHIPCDLATALSRLKDVMQPAVVNRPVPELYSLCDGCWKAMDTVWTTAEHKPGGTYTGAAAKGTADGIFFHTSMPDYQAAGRAAEADLQKIRCTVVHEMVHYQVAVTTHGFQGVVTTLQGMNTFCWDECMTDMLAFRTADRLGWRPYKTGYGEWARFIETNLGLLQRTPAYARQATVDGLARHFPAEVATLTAANFQATLPTLAERLGRAIFKELCQRYTQSNNRGASTFDAFTKDVFSKSLNARLGQLRSMELV